MGQHSPWSGLSERQKVERLYNFVKKLAEQFEGHVHVEGGIKVDKAYLDLEYED